MEEGKQSQLCLHSSFSFLQLELPSYEKLTDPIIRIFENPSMKIPCCPVGIFFGGTRIKTNLPAGRRVARITSYNL